MRLPPSSSSPYYLGARAGDTSSNSADAGGLRLGEFIAYERSLSEEEIRDVSAYLMRKWLPAEKSQKTDLGGLYLKASTAQTVAVPEGRLAQVGEIHAKAGAFVKDGAGTLALPRPLAGDAKELAVGNRRYAETDLTVPEIVAILKEAKLK